MDESSKRGTRIVLCGVHLESIRRRPDEIALENYVRRKLCEKNWTAFDEIFGIPGTVFGVGMLWAYVSTPLYLTLWILMLAFVIRYLVYGVRTSSNGLMQIDRTLEEAATVAGAAPLRGFLFVNLPLLKPVIASTWLLVFMIVMREISASIILSGVNSVTLPILTWGYLVDGSYGIASALSILQLLIVGAIVLAFRWLFGIDVRTRSHD